MRAVALVVPEPLLGSTFACLGPDGLTVEQQMPWPMVYLAVHLASKRLDAAVGY